MRLMYYYSILYPCSIKKLITFISLTSMLLSLSTSGFICYTIVELICFKFNTLNTFDLMTRRSSLKNLSCACEASACWRPIHLVITIRNSSSYVHLNTRLLLHIRHLFQIENKSSTIIGLCSAASSEPINLRQYSVMIFSAFWKMS